MSKINRVPRGLQDFFGNVAAGENPDVLLNEVRANIDLLPFWAFEKTEWLETRNAVTGPGGGSYFTVPDGELWIPLSLGGEIRDMPVGDTLSMSVRVYTAVTVSSIPLAWTGHMVSVAANSRFPCGYQWVRPVIYEAGDLLSVQMDEFTYSGGPAQTLDATLHYIRLKN